MYSENSEIRAFGVGRPNAKSPIKRSKPRTVAELQNEIEQLEKLAAETNLEGNSNSTQGKFIQVSLGDLRKELALLEAEIANEPRR